MERFVVLLLTEGAPAGFMLLALGFILCLLMRRIERWWTGEVPRQTTPGVSKLSPPDPPALLGRPRPRFSRRAVGLSVFAFFAILIVPTCTTAGYLDAFFPYLWWLHRLEAPAAWSRVGAGPPVVVAVIDSGISTTHPDLTGRLLRDATGRLRGYNLADSRQALEDPTDVDGHGTHIAGIIAGLTHGIGERVRLLPLKITDARGRPSLYAIIEALELARLMRVDIVNLSLAMDLPAYELERAIRLAAADGILVVAGAGQAHRTEPRVRNLDEGDRSVFPAGYSLEYPILSVTASDEEDDLPWWTNYGPHAVQVAAPGVSIWSTLPRAGYGGRSGTSMATAVASGVAALAKARYPHLGGAALRDWLLRHTSPLRERARPLVASGGRVSALRAVAPREG